MNYADYGLSGRMGGSSFSTSHPLTQQGISINSYADALFCPRFKWEGLQVALPNLKGRQSAGPTRAQILEW
jgi:hypothetical protein